MHVRQVADGIPVENIGIDNGDFHIAIVDIFSEIVLTRRFRQSGGGGCRRLGAHVKVAQPEQSHYLPDPHRCSTLLRAIDAPNKLMCDYLLKTKSSYELAQDRQTNENERHTHSTLLTIHFKNPRTRSFVTIPEYPDPTREPQRQVRQKEHTCCCFRDDDLEEERRKRTPENDDEHGHNTQHTTHKQDSLFIALITQPTTHDDGTNANDHDHDDANANANDHDHDDVGSQPSIDTTTTTTTTTNDDGESARTSWIFLPSPPSLTHSLTHSHSLTRTNDSTLACCRP